MTAPIPIYIICSQEKKCGGAPDWLLWLLIGFLIAAVLWFVCLLVTDVLRERKHRNKPSSPTAFKVNGVWFNK